MCITEDKLVDCYETGLFNRILFEVEYNRRKQKFIGQIMTNKSPVRSIGWRMTSPRGIRSRYRH